MFVFRTDVSEMHQIGLALTVQLCVKLLPSGSKQLCAGPPTPQKLGVVSGQPDLKADRAAAAAAAWSVHTAPSGILYYYNSLTRESTYTRPDALGAHVRPSGPTIPPAAAESPVPVSADVIPGTQWKRVMCEDGRIYFCNISTNTTVWTAPPEIAQRVAALPASRHPPLRLVPPFLPHPRLVPQQVYPYGSANAHPPMSGGVAHLNPLPSPPAQNREAPATDNPPAHTVVTTSESVAPVAGPARTMGSVPAAWAAWARGVHQAGPKQSSAEDPAEVAERNFRKMLAEHDVDEFSRWEKACKKFESDSRYGCDIDL
jgi:hypothetical protein